MMPQQMQLQQIQIQPSGLTGQAQLQGQQQTQYVTSQDTHQQIQNQLIQSQQLAMQQQAQNNLNAQQANAQIQQITIQQQPKQQILIGQQSAAQSQASMENRPIMTMVSIGGGGNTSASGNHANNTISTLNAMQNLGSPMNSPQHLTIQPPPNPLAAMTSLSYSATPSTILTNSSSNIGKDDKNTTKLDDTQKSHTNESNVLVSTSTTNGTTVTTVANGSITISSATSTPVTSLASNNKLNGKLTFKKTYSMVIEHKFNEI